MKDTRVCKLCGKVIKDDYARIVCPVGFELLNFCMEHEGDKRLDEIVNAKKKELEEKSTEEFYHVDSCVCDYGIYNIDGKLELVLSQRKNAEDICRIMNEDYRSQEPIRNIKCYMKFYEFNRTEYYALIGANTLEEAIELYKAVVADIEDKDNIEELVDILGVEEAKEKYCKVLSEEVTDPKSEIEKTFYQKAECKSYVFLLDNCLL
ncbi:hypothetical protein [Clostridium sp. B9]|uniref:hypothetical protein n=1 Tax=Clostridium sp. B9 TaxID=3423224 RepID=UPI003D2EF675